MISGSTGDTDPQVSSPGGTRQISSFQIYVFDAAAAKAEILQDTCGLDSDRLAYTPMRVNEGGSRNNFSVEWDSGNGHFLKRDKIVIAIGSTGDAA